MNSTPAPDAPEAAGRPTAHPGGHDRVQDASHAAGAVEPTTVPRQPTGGFDGQLATGDDTFAGADTFAGVPVADQLDHPDPLKAADAAAVENLLRCWVRENALPRPEGQVLRIPLHASGTALLVPVRYWSETGWHRFGMPFLESAPRDAPAAEAVTVAALLGRESGRYQGGELVGRVANSLLHTADFLADRRRAPQAAPDADLFLTAEQSLLLGHPLHPTPKSREGLSEAGPGSTHRSRAAPSRCTGWPSTGPYSPPTPPGPSRAASCPPTSSRHASSVTSPFRRTPSPCLSIPGRHVS